MKKFISLLLSVILVLSMIQGIVFAEGETNDASDEPVASEEPAENYTLNQTDRVLIPAWKCVGTNITDIEKKVENECLPFGLNNYVEHQVTVAEEGFYNMYVLVGTGGDKKLEISVNGGITSAPTFEATGGLFDQQERKVRTVYLKADTYTFKILNKSEDSYYFKSLIFEPGKTPALSETEETLVSAFEFVDSTSSSKPRGENNHVVPVNGVYMDYKITAPKAGIYKISFCGGNPGDFKLTSSIYNASAAAYQRAYTQTLTGTGNYMSNSKIDMRYLNLAEGENIIRITSNSTYGFYFKGLAFEYFEGVPVSATERTEFSALSYTKASNVRFESSNLVPKVNGYGEYTVKAETAGYYDIFMNFGTNGTVKIKSTVNGAMEMTETPETTGGATKVAERKVRTAYLNEGINTIRLAQVGGSDFYFKSVIFVPISGLPVSETEETVFSAMLYSATGSTRVENPYLVPFTNGWAEYIVDVKKEGLYNLSIYMGGGNRTFETTINGVKTLKTAIEGTTGLTDIQKKNLRTVWLNEGTNTIRIKQTVGSEFYFKSVALDFSADSIALSDTDEVKFSTLLYSNASNVRDENEVLVPKKNGFAEYKITVLLSGIYDITAFMGSDTDRNVSLSLDGEEIASATLTATTGFLDIQPRKVKTVYIEEGTYTLKVTGLSGEFYLKMLSFKPSSVEEIGLDLGKTEISALDYSSYFDSTRLNPVEKINDGTALELVTNEWFEYKVTVPIDGEYGLAFSFASADTEEKQAEITIDSENAITVTLLGTGLTSSTDFALCDMQKITLKAGENTIRIKATVGKWYLDRLCVYYPGVQFYDTYTGGEPIEEVKDGDLYGKIFFGGFMINENVNYYMAVYETNEKDIKKLAYIDAGNITVNENSIPTLTIKGIEKKEGSTYTAKIFIWQNMAGREYELK